MFFHVKLSLLHSTMIKLLYLIFYCIENQSKYRHLKLYYLRYY